MSHFQMYNLMDFSYLRLYILRHRVTIQKRTQLTQFRSATLRADRYVYLRTHWIEPSSSKGSQTRTILRQSLYPPLVLQPLLNLHRQAMLRRIIRSLSTKDMVTCLTCTGVIFLLS